MSSTESVRRNRRHDSRGRRPRSRHRNNNNYSRPQESRKPATLLSRIQSFFKKLLGGKKQDTQRTSSPRTSSAPQNGAASHASEEVQPEVHTPKLYIGNLSYDTSESDLYDLFQQVGVVKNVEVVRDRNSNSKGFGFVEMETLDSAKAASSKFHRTEFMGRQLVVSGAKS